eukprot:460594-Pelagomonas_calceolata.AAC.3
MNGSHIFFTQRTQPEADGVETQDEQGTAINERQLPWIYYPFLHPSQTFSALSCQAVRYILAKCKVRTSHSRPHPSDELTRLPKHGPLRACCLSRRLHVAPARQVSEKPPCLQAQHVQQCSSNAVMQSCTAVREATLLAGKHKQAYTAVMQSAMRSRAAVREATLLAGTIRTAVMQSYFVKHGKACATQPCKAIEFAELKLQKGVWQLWSADWQLIVQKGIMQFNSRGKFDWKACKHCTEM